MGADLITNEDGELELEIVDYMTGEVVETVNIERDEEHPFQIEISKGRSR